MPAEEIGEAIIGNLSVTNGVIKEAQRLLERGQSVPGVHLVEVDLFHAEPPQRSIECIGQVLAGEAQVVGTVAHREATLGGDDEVAQLLALEPAPDDLLGGAVAVDVGGVEEIATGLDIGVHHLKGRGLVGFLAEGHGAEAVGGDDGAAIAELAIFHWGSSRRV